MYIIYGIVSLVIIFFDQITKAWASVELLGGEPVILIKNFLQFNYLVNRGASFGILQGKFTVFVVATIIILVVILFVFIMDKKITTAGRISLLFIFSGAVGNFIDRIRFRYVIDFIDVNFGNFYDFPVFNVADSFVVMGTLLLVILILANKFENVDKYGKYKINIK